MIFTPRSVEGRELVDGGLLAPMPIAATRRGAADLVVAIDVNARSARPLISPEIGETEDEAHDPGGLDAAAGLRARVAAWIDSFGEKTTPARTSVASSSLVDLMSRSLDTMQGQLSRLQLALDPPDLLIRVPRDICLFHEFWRASELIEIGREAAQRALAAARS
jgi:NTE family protein